MERKKSVVLLITDFSNDGIDVFFKREQINTEHYTVKRVKTDKKGSELNKAIKQFKRDYDINGNKGDRVYLLNEGRWLI